MSEPLPSRFAEYIATLREGDRVSMSRYPELRSQAWWDPATLPLARALEAAAPAIIAEFRPIERTAFVPEREPIARHGSWDVYLLYDRGRRHDEHCAQAPTAAAIIDAQRTVRSLAGLAYFSRLGPHTRVAPHAGPTNMRVRLHLGIDVPSNCGIRAGDVSATWTTGKCLAFDDSFLHEVWNESDRERIVLVVDCWHPDLTDDEVRLLEGFQGYVERAARNLERYWSANDPA